LFLKQKTKEEEAENNYGILPPSSIKGLRTDKNCKGAGGII
jgi:hypothetical protein